LLLDDKPCINLNSKRMKTDVQNHYALKNQMPDLIKDAYDFNESYAENKCHTTVYSKE